MRARHCVQHCVVSQVPSAYSRHRGRRRRGTRRFQRSRSRRSHRHRHARAESGRQDSRRHHRGLRGGIQRTLMLTEDATAVLARTVPGYSESSQADEQSRRDAARSCAAAPVRRHPAEHAVARRQPQRRVHRHGYRRPHRSDQRPVRGRRHRRRGRHHQLHLQGRRPSRAETSTLHARCPRSSRTTATAGRPAARSPTSPTLTTWCSTARSATAASPTTANGRRIGLTASSSSADSETEEPVPEGRLRTSAPTAIQRLQFSASHFKIDSKGNYHWVEGSRALGIPRHRRARARRSAPAACRSSAPSSTSSSSTC